jgi:hypothetical protein
LSDGLSSVIVTFLPLDAINMASINASTASQGCHERNGIVLSVVSQRGDGENSCRSYRGRRRRGRQCLKVSVNSLGRDEAKEQGDCNGHLDKSFTHIFFLINYNLLAISSTLY